MAVTRAGWPAVGFVVALFLAAGSAASAGQEAAPAGAVPAGVTFVDHRTNVQPGNVRAFYSPMNYFGEKGLKPPALPRFEEALRAHAPAGAAWEVVIEEFQIIDYFPVRAPMGGTGIVPAMTQEAVRKKTDWALIGRLGVPPDTEAVILRFKGTVNGKPVLVEVFAPYEYSLLSIWIYDDKHFKAAVAKIIDDGAAKAVNIALGLEPNPKPDHGDSLQELAARLHGWTGSPAPRN